MDFYTFTQIARGISVFSRLLNAVIWIYCIMSWVASPTNKVYRLLSNFVAPILAPFRKLTQLLFKNSRLMIDISPILASIALELLTRVLFDILMRFVHL